MPQVIVAIEGVTQPLQADGRARGFVTVWGDGAQYGWFINVEVFFAGVDSAGNRYDDWIAYQQIRSEETGFRSFFFDATPEYISGGQYLTNNLPKVGVLSARWSLGTVHTDPYWLGTAASPVYIHGQTALSGTPVHTYTLVQTLQPLNIRTGSTDTLKGFYRIETLDQFYKPMFSVDEAIEFPHAGTGPSWAWNESLFSITRPHKAWGDDDSTMTTDTTTNHTDTGGYARSGKGIGNAVHTSIHLPVVSVPNPERPFAVVVNPPTQAAPRNTSVLFTVSQVRDEDGDLWSGNLTPEVVNRASGSRTLLPAFYVSNGSGSFSYLLPNTAANTAEYEFYVYWIDPVGGGYQPVGAASAVSYNPSAIPTQPFPTTLLLYTTVANAYVPAPAVAKYGQTVVLTASVRDQYNNPSPNKPVTFTRYTGTAQVVNVVNTDGNGYAAYSYSRPDPGVGAPPTEDLVVADAGGSAKGVNSVTWYDDPPPPPPPPPPAPTMILLTREPATATPAMTTGQVASFRAKVLSQYGVVMPGQNVSLIVSGVNGAATGTQKATALTDTAGDAVFSYTGTVVGADLAHAQIGATTTSNRIAVAWAAPGTPALLVNASPVVVATRTDPGNFSASATLELVKSDGTPAVGVTVSRSDNAASLAAQTAATNAQGLVTFTWSLAESASPVTTYFWGSGASSYNGESNALLKSTSTVETFRTYVIVPDRPAYHTIVNKPVTFRVRVVGGAATPVSGHVVTFTNQTFGLPSSTSASSGTATTDASGYASFTVTPSTQGGDTYIVRVSNNPDYPPTTIHLAASNRTPVLTEADNKVVDVQPNN